MLYRLAFILLIAATPLIASAQPAADPYDPWTRAALYRDRWGVPHVYAGDVFAMSYVFGYAQAEDHLEEMLFAYRVVLGRASEVWGEEYVESDTFSLRMRHGVLAQDYLRSGDEMTRDLCEGFVSGVNAWMNEHPDQVPTWAERVQPEAPLALLHAYMMSFAPLDSPNLWRRDPAGGEGVAFALAPQRAHTGTPALAFAIEGSYSGPFRWYEAHLVIDSLNVYGATLFGLPVMLMGHGPSVAWAMTPNRSDFADVYLVEPGFGGSQAANRVGGPVGASGGDWASYVLAHTRMLNVRTAGGLEPRPIECLVDSEGPVIGAIDGKLAVWRIGGYWQLGTMRQLMAMAMANNLDAMYEAISWRQIPCFHIVAADRSGSITYLYNSTVGDKDVAVVESFFGPDGPVGAGRADAWSYPIDSSDARMQWGPVLPLSSLPSMINPGGGYVQASGNPPWRADHTGGNIIAENFPAWFINDPDTRRAARLRDMLRHGKRTFDQVQATLFDTHVPEVGPLVGRLNFIAEQKPDLLANAHPDAPRAAQLLSEWTRAAEPDSEGMTLFNAWWAAVSNRADELGMTMSRAAQEASVGSDDGDIFLVQTLGAAVQGMGFQFDSMLVPWGDVHVLRRGSRESALPGAASGGSVWTSRPGRFDGRVWPASGGYTYAMAIALGENPRSATVVPFGASERPASKHFDDQMDMYLGRRMKPTHFSLDSVQRETLHGYGRKVYIQAGGVQGSVALYSDERITARLDADVQGPTPPPGLAPCSLFWRPTIIEGESSVSLEAWVHVAEALVPDDALYAVALFRHSPGEGWSVIADQTLDAATRVLHAVDVSVGDRYVLFGPEELMLASAAPEVDSNMNNTFAAAGAPAVGDLGEYAPLAPLTETEADRQARKEPSPLDDPSGQRFIGERPTPMARGEGEPAALDPLMLEGDSPRGQVPQFSRARKKVEPLQFDVRDSTDWVSGTDIAISVPGTKHRLSFSANTLIRARVAALNGPPLPIPSGLIAYSSFVAGEHDPKPAKAEVFVSMTPTNKADVGLEGLQVYACDAEHGWRLLKRQRFSEQDQIYSAIDGSPKTYAILGPAR